MTIAVRAERLGWFRPPSRLRRVAAPAVGEGGDATETAGLEHRDDRMGKSRRAGTHATLVGFTFAPTSQRSRHRTAHDPVHFVPRQLEPACNGRRTRALEDGAVLTGVEVAPSPTGCDFRLRGDREHERKEEGGIFPLVE